MPNCKDCTLSGDRVPGTGGSNPDIVFVGEAPGAEEDKQGVPFVGKAGQVLRSVINYLKLDEESYYLTNVCLCRPPENREPSSNEIECCYQRLVDEIRDLKPKVVVTLGSTPTKTLFGSERKISKDRGKVFRTHWVDIPGIPTYHPAATLYAKGDTLFPFLLGDITKAVELARGELNSDPQLMETKVKIIDTDEDMMKVIDTLMCMQKDTIISFDWETTGVSHLWDVGFCLGLSWEEGTAVVLPMKMVRRWSAMLYSVLEDKRLTGFNAVGFDSAWNRKYGLPHKVAFDPMLWHYLLDERPQERSLENLTSYLLNAPCYESDMMAEFKADKSNMIKIVPPEVIYEYCGKDVDWTLRLANHFNSRIREDEGDLVELYQVLLHPAAEALAEIEEHGLWVDRDKLEELDVEMQQTLIELNNHLKILTENESFNPNSHPQVQAHLWDTLKLIQPQIYGRKDRSADKDTLAALMENYQDVEFIPKLLEYRETFTLYSKYVRDLPNFIESDGRVRTNYHLDRTETGRLATTKPAIHQTPRDSKIRTVYSAPPGYTLVQADYSQIEIRVAAMLADDDKLIEFLDSGADFHSTMASEAFGVALKNVTEDQRQAAKSVSFGLLYGMSDKGLIAKTGLNRGSAVEFIKEYKKQMPGVQEWIQAIKDAIRTEQYITSPFGRRRRFPFVTNENIEGLYREGVNFPIQSGAADITLRSVLVLHNLFKSVFPEAHIVITVHDSIVVECPEVIAEDVAKLMKNVMEDVSKKVSFPVEIKIGKCWGDSS